jgi:hypothetical protein
MVKHRAIAPVLDLICLAAFVAVGGRRHDDLNEGFGWRAVALLVRRWRPAPT